jgi:hypothetical protein
VRASHPHLSRVGELVLLQLQQPLTGHLHRTAHAPHPPAGLNRGLQRWVVRFDKLVSTGIQVCSSIVFLEVNGVNRGIQFSSTTTHPPAGLERAGACKRVLSLALCGHSYLARKAIHPSCKSTCTHCACMRYLRGRKGGRVCIHTAIPPVRYDTHCIHHHRAYMGLTLPCTTLHCASTRNVLENSTAKCQFS